jgi:hypothetical protein
MGMPGRHEGREAHVFDADSFGDNCQLCVPSPLMNTQATDARFHCASPHRPLPVSIAQSDVIVKPGMPLSSQERAYRAHDSLSNRFS